ncbi:MAG: DUF1311 domain-containing protein [Bradyrhizobium sp.]|uniref:lysozyme inhibitor LprI family protein n=1 Tax=Bradyrhizobium sp. TaxID=376 RepID=UPI001C296E26|nr:lysozyme inhibitor LprI family protein [Bradyrhizobium sp.]MBU6461759.1 DUF1311 domain-containing protein [Pseudomonadota bacterium]MDE2068006.1 DUF1311 domain-containing protein [Bradyrhizobium sp.]MDE2241045.1 DUF1311 domain-containing protein [Bradyrhizobium sp.]MDE2472946.1 DUF1311 domain-containing protein [Bradyrhizobium sp.]
MKLPPALRIALISILPLACGVAAETARAQTRKPSANEIVSIRTCATRNKDNLENGERLCLFRLVAQPCMGKQPDNASEQAAADCFGMEGAIWDGLLNENYQALLDTLDSDQTIKAQAMQRAWIAYRDTTCQFYDDKIRGSMSVRMHAACVARETARRSMLLKFFVDL